MVDTGVLTASSIAAATGPDYARYLDAKTVAPDRGRGVAQAWQPGAPPHEWLSL